MRIRTIKPEFWKHDLLSELPESTHMLAAALLNYADDEGYFNANPSLIKADCFPLREPSVSVHDSLTALSRINFIEFGVGPDGRTYGRVVKFAEHQRVNRPTPSKIKAFVKEWRNSVRTHTQLSESSLPEKEQGTGNREEEREREREQGKESLVGQPDDVGDDPKPDEQKQKSHKADSLADKAARVVAHYQTYHPRAYPSGLNEKSKPWALLKLRWTEGYSVDDVCRAIDGMHLSEFHCGHNERNTEYLGLDIAVKTGDQVTKFIQLADNPPRKLSEKTKRTVNAGQQWAKGGVA